MTQYATIITLAPSNDVCTDLGWDEMPLVDVVLDLSSDHDYFPALDVRLANDDVGLREMRDAWESYAGFTFLPFETVFTTRDGGWWVRTDESQDIWRAKVAAGDTMLGYDQWVAARRMGQAGFDPPPDEEAT
jgi:hypothetical protein